MADKKVICLWSGGKDSCFAAYLAKNKGLDIKYLLNFTEDDKYSLSHNISSRLINSQMRITKLPFIQRPLGKLNYEECFSKVLDRVKKEGIKSIVFGDIYLQEHRDWLENFCKREKMRPIFALWNTSTDKIIHDFISAGFKSILVNVKKSLLSKDWLSRSTDKKFINDLAQIEPKIDPCGERGEFHTFVIDGPLFSSRINILKTKIVSRNDRHSLDILDYEVIKKKK